MWQETIKRKQINQPTKYFTKPESIKIGEDVNWMLLLYLSTNFRRDLLSNLS